MTLIAKQKSFVVRTEYPVKIFMKIFKKGIDKPVQMCYNNYSEGEIKMLERLENQVIQKYGFEHKLTIAVFWLTHLLRKVR